LETFKSYIISNKRVSLDTYRLKLWIKRVPGIKPGQFLLIKTGVGSLDPLLPRPFAIYDYSKNWIDVVYRVVGRMTLILSEMTENNRIVVTLPCGNGFSERYSIKSIIKSKNKCVSFVAGGTGIASLNLLGRELQKNGIGINLYYGDRTKGRLLGIEELSYKPSKLLLTTEDGSYGKKGVITDFLNDVKEPVFSSGPLAMLKVLNEKYRNLKNCYVSVERRMGCGFGVCLGCVIRVRKGEEEYYSRVCKDGPVFNINEIVWD